MLTARKSKLGGHASLATQVGPCRTDVSGGGGPPETRGDKELHMNSQALDLLYLNQKSVATGCAGVRKFLFRSLTREKS